MGNIANLVAAYLMDEVSGNRADASGNGITLTDNNTVGSGVGRFNNAADFERSNSEYLSAANPTSLKFLATSFSVVLSVKPESITTDNGLVHKGNFSTGWVLNYKQGDSGTLQLYFGSSVVASVTGVGMTAGNWYTIAVIFDDSANTVVFRVNKSTLATVTSVTSNPSDGTARFGIGERGSDSGAEGWDGLIDDVALFSRAISVAEADDIADNGLEDFITPVNGNMLLMF
jgi:hypothetical protein